MEVSMLFGMIFALIVIVFLLAGGMGMVTDTLGLGGQAAMQNQVKEMSKLCDSVYWSSQGSSKSFSFKFIGGPERVCFLNHKDPRANPSMGWAGDVAVEMMAKDEKKSMAVFQVNKEYQMYGLGNCLADSSFCVRRSAELLFTNKGDRVAISMVK